MRNSEEAILWAAIVFLVVLMLALIAFAATSTDKACAQVTYNPSNPSYYSPVNPGNPMNYAPGGFYGPPAEQEGGC